MAVTYHLTGAGIESQSSPDPLRPQIVLESSWDRIDSRFLSAATSKGSTKSTGRVSKGVSKAPKDHTNIPTSTEFICFSNLLVLIIKDSLKDLGRSVQLNFIFAKPQ